jgi:threonylcarbamoyladenosine tRNA methylthiotransferase MtaB
MANEVIHKVKFVTLGCKLNFSETATIGQQLQQRGIATSAKNGETPDICVVNTCSVTALADRKCRQQIRSLIKRYPEALVAITGCYAQLQGKNIAEIPGVDIVLGNEQKGDIVDYIEAWLKNRKNKIAVTPNKDIRRFAPSCECGDRTRYFLKVQDGCDYYCSYCTIPLARGRSRSGTIASLVEQAQDVAQRGGKEIVITGVNIGDFGKNTGERFFDLIKALDQVEGIERYRISSIEPDLLDDEVIDWCATSRAFMPHFHIPLQSGNDEVLRLMRRHYDRNLFARKVERIHQVMPHAFIGVDVMVGTRGETPEFFDDSLQFIASLGVQHLHVFPYSERPGTMALSIPYIVEKRIRDERVAQMMALSDRQQRQFIERFLGSERPVLFEHPQRGGAVMHGFTDNYIRVNAPYCQRLVNAVAMARLNSINDDLSVDAEIIETIQ